MADRHPDPTSLDDFAPWRHVDHLPAEAPIRCLQPHELPTPFQVRARLTAEGIDPDRAAAIITALFARGWSFWLLGTPRPRRTFAAYVLEPRDYAVWATGRGVTPAEALGAVLVLCLDTPPWEVRPEDYTPPEALTR